jgi:iron complex outermembrane receptor protein
MSRKKGKNEEKTHRVGVLGVSSIIGAMALTPALAQAQDGEDEIIVTGTRIQRPDFEFSNPVVSATEEELQEAGTTNLTDYLQQIPALTNSLNNNEGFPSTSIAGLDLLNLRNLGVDRTLVLVNGRRHVPGLAGSGAVDVNTIPTDLVERVDVLTGGASAIYGADGVSGVVNFIMRDDFEGVRVRAQAGMPEEEGSDSYFASITMGHNINDRGNLAGSFEYSLDTELLAADRDFSRNETRFVPNPFPDGVYQRIPLSDLRWFESSPGGAVDVDLDGFADFDATSDAPWQSGTIFDPSDLPPNIGFTYQQGGDGTPTSGYTRGLIPEVERFAANIFGHYDLTPNARLFAELKFVHTNTSNAIQPAFDYYLAQYLDNPFIPPNILDAALTADTGEGFVFVTRDHLDLGYSALEAERETARVAIGLEGDFAGDIDYNISFTAGELSEHNTNVNAVLLDRFAAAIDAVDPDGGGPLGPTCRINVDPNSQDGDFNVQGRFDYFGYLQNFPTPRTFAPGECVPLNIFGDGSPSPEAVNWVTADLTERDRVTQQVFSAYLTGDADRLFTLPAGSVGWAAGVEWRRETMETNPAVEDQIGATESLIEPGRGSYEVREAFAEVDVPILQDVTLADSLSFDAAARFSEYSTIGTTQTWKIGLQYSPFADLAFRATRAEAVRAPNIGELFGPEAVTFDFITDPCRPDQWELGADPALREANCEAILTAAGVADPSTFVDAAAAFTKRGQTRGFDGLEEETAETDTFGLIYRPSFLPGFSFSADYYDIRLGNAIRTLEAQEVADACVDAVSIDNNFCDLITRQVGGSSAGAITNFVVTPQNVSAYTTRGIDFTMAYLLDTADWSRDWGTFEFRLLGNNLQELTFVNTPGAAPDPDLGEYSGSEGLSAPEWQAAFDVTWEIGAWTTHYSFNFTSDQLRYDQVILEGNPDFVAPEYKYLEGLRTHDVQVRYEVNDGLQIYGGVNDFTDQGVAYGAGAFPTDGNGRFFYVGAVSSW